MKPTNQTEALPRPTSTECGVSHLANTVHELRTPLASIRATLDLLQLGGIPPAEQNDLLEGATVAALHLEHLIGDILDDAAIGADHLRLQRQGHRVCNLLDDLSRIIRLQALDRGIRLAIVDPDVELTAHTDARRFLQIALNLVGNALKFAPRGGTVAVDVEATASCVRFLVSDDGPGIPESTRDRLFTPFADIAPQSQVRGTGLGLALCRQLVRRLGGQIGFQPKHPHGSTFWFELPRVVAPGLDRT